MKSITTKYIFFPVLVLLCLAGLASCDYIHDELPLCRHTLRFVYRHNIKHADAFAYEMENQEAAKMFVCIFIVLMASFFHLA